MYAVTWIRPGKPVPGEVQTSDEEFAQEVFDLFVKSGSPQVILWRDQEVQTMSASGGPHGQRGTK